MEHTFVQAGGLLLPPESWEEDGYSIGRYRDTQIRWNELQWDYGTVDEFTGFLWANRWSPWPTKEPPTTTVAWGQVLSLPPYRALFTGSREWTDPDPVVKLLKHLRASMLFGRSCIVVEGGAQGLDAMVRRLCKPYGLVPESHPVPKGDWDRFGPPAGNMRNTYMVSLGANVCYGFPLGKARGTTDCMCAAKAAGIPTYCYQDGMWSAWPYTQRRQQR